MKDKKTFGNFIKQKRIEKNYSQKDLADLLFVTESAVSKWERGVTYPDITLITDICRVLGVTEHELIESSHDEEYRKMKKEADKYNKIKKTLFWTLNICYAIALLVCFIVNLAVDHTLSWFFIVLISIIVAYSFCPTFVWVYEKYKKLIFIGSTFISLFLLFLTCSIYSDDYWFMMPTIGVLIAYFIIFYPILFKTQEKYMIEEKYGKLNKWFMITYLAGILLLIILLLIAIYCYNSFNLLLGIYITIGCFIIPFIISIVLLFKNGKKLIKPITISLVGILIVYFIIGTIASLNLMDTSEINTHIIEDSYIDIEIDVVTSDINILLTTDKENKIVCKDNKKVNIEANVIDNKLIIKQYDNRNLFEKLFNFTDFKFDLYLTVDSFNSLNIDCTTSDINIDEGLNFNDVLINDVTGDIIFKSNVSNDINIKNTTGDIIIKNSKINGDVKIKTTTGDIKLENVSCNNLNIIVDTGKSFLKETVLTGDLNIDGGTGDVKFNSFDANNIKIKLTTGDVKGTILSNKIFKVKSTTGDIEVPYIQSGGNCVINVTTGDVIIEYK